MASRGMKSRGDLNIYLNGLVRQGVIEGFATNNPSGSVVLDLTVQVKAWKEAAETLERVKAGLSGKFAHLPVTVAPN